MNSSSRDLLDRIIVAAERYVDVSPSTEFSPLVLSAIAGAALREVAELKAQLPVSVKWVMMSCVSPDSTSWRVVELTATDRVHARPLSVVLPEFITCSVQEYLAILQTEQVPTTIGNTILKPLAVDTSRMKAIALPPVDHLYFRASTLRLPEPYSLAEGGWLVGADGDLDATGEAHVDFCLSHAERVISDRFFQGLGGYRPIASILASIDDDFQHSLLAARSGSGLSAILGSFSPAYSASLDRLSPHEEPVKGLLPEHDKAEVHRILELSGTELEKIVTTRIRETFGLDDAIIKVSPKGDVNCRYGNWHGHVEFGSGFGGLRSRTILFSVCDSSQSVQVSLARYFSIVRQNPKNLELFLLLTNMDRSAVEEYSQNWQLVKGVYFGRLQ